MASKSKYGAYMGRVLKIDLTTRTSTDYPFSDKERELFLGGKIMAAKIIYDMLIKDLPEGKKIDPLGEENVIVVSTCPLNGLYSPSSSRFNISTISPLTGILTSSNCGGSFGMRLKMAGYDALILTGKSEERIFIEINNDEIEFKNADELWGLETAPAQEAIQKLYKNQNTKSGKIVIGPAGENMVRFSCVVSDDRCAGRGGVGAVMGSKNLKAVTARGTHKVEPAKKEKFQEISKYWTNQLKKHPLTGNQMPKLGTAGLLTPMQSKHLLATKNFSAGRFDNFEKISGERLTEEFLVKNSGCVSCPIRCARNVMVDGKVVKGPEVETLGLLGANIMNDSMESILKWNYELDELGMDTISAAGTIAFAMELHERGLWDSGLEFGKTDNISEIWHDMAFRRTEVGDQLANGSKWLAEKYGAKEYAINVKGMELSAYEPRSAVGQGLGYAVSNRGGCHLNGGYNVILEGLGLNLDQHTPKGKAAFTTTFQNLMEAVSAGGNCLFTTYAFFPSFVIEHPNHIITRVVNKAAPHIGVVLYIANKMPFILSVNLKPLLPHPVGLSHATGMKLNFGKMIAIGNRGYQLERLINTRLGISAKDDILPKRLTDDLQQPDVPNSKVPIDVLRKNYYRCRGWDKNGIPKKGVVKKLGIDLPKEGKSNSSNLGAAK